MGVALENARLFDETKAPLGRDRARNAELAVITEIGAALARAARFRRRSSIWLASACSEIFTSASLFIGLYDPAADMIHFPYAIEPGKRTHDRSDRAGRGPHLRIIKTTQGAPPPRRAARAGTGAIGSGVAPASSQSWLGVPILAGERVLGVIALESARRNAFTEADERLLSTLASSMGVALENARLFDETKRLLAETDERAAELAIVNSVQEGLAAEPRHAVDVRPRGRQDPGDLRRTGRRHRHRRPRDGTGSPSRTPSSAACASRTSRCRSSAPRKHVLEIASRCVVNENRAPRRQSYGQHGVIQRRGAAVGALCAPLVGGQALGVISLQNLDREFAFSESDVRLLTTLASSLAWRWRTRACSTRRRSAGRDRRARGRARSRERDRGRVSRSS